MSILQATSSITGLAGVIPNLVFINTNDSVATVTTTGYLSKAVHENLLTVSNGDMALVNTTSGVVFLAVAITGTAPNLVYSLVTPSSSGGSFAGNVQAGSSGVAGDFISYPASASKGNLVVAATANSGNTAVTVTNASQAGVRTFTIPDPSATTANFVLAPSALVSGNVVKASGTVGAIVDAGFTLHANTTAAYAGGGTSNAYVATGIGSTSIVTASILASTNAVSITKVVPSANTLTVSFSADPGASTTVSWIAVTPAV
jgi:hypothetical protein